MGKGELKIVIGPDKPSQDSPSSVSADEASSTLLINTDGPKTKVKLGKKSNVWYRPIESIPFPRILTPIYTNKVCSRVAYYAMLGVAVASVSFLLAGLVMNYEKVLQSHQGHKGNVTHKPVVSEDIQTNTPPTPRVGSNDNEDEPDEAAKNCVHRRHDETCGNYSIIHDTRSRWSAVINHKRGLCFLFNPIPNEVGICPKDYPWIMDKNLGILPRKLPESAPAEMKQFQAKYKRVSRCVLSFPHVDLPLAGETIYKACIESELYRVLGVVVVYGRKGRQPRSVADEDPKTFPELHYKLDHIDDDTRVWSPYGNWPLDRRTRFRDSRWIATIMDNEGKELKSTDPVYM